MPSTAVALALAAALGVEVEGLFQLREDDDSWAWRPTRSKARHWRAEVRGRLLRYPAEPTACGVVPHDRLDADSQRKRGLGADPAKTLVLVGCDPSSGLLAEHLKARGVRLLALLRPSGEALDLLREGVVHVAGFHLAPSLAESRRLARGTLGDGYRLLHLARWQEGLAVAPSSSCRSVASALSSDLRWVGRGEGSGARRLMDSLLEGRRAPRGSDHVASDHRGVVEAIRGGWADVGVCIRMVAEDGGLVFLPVQEESYDLCFPVDAEDDPRIQALLTTVRSAGFRRMMADLPGYDTRASGELA